MERKKYRINLILILIIIVGFSVFSFIRGGENTSFELTEETFTLRGPEDFSTVIALKNISFIEFRENFAPGTCINGGTERGCSWGTWENVEFGQYCLCTLSKLKTAMVITEWSGMVTVCNFESEQTTEDFYQYMVRYLQDNGFLT